MRVAILYYPMLFQRTGGLQVQVCETAHALRGIGVDAVLFDYSRHRLVDFDIAHVFSVISGNHRIVEQARSDGLPVVLSTVLHPPWSKAQNGRANLLSRVAARLSGWSFTTTHQQIQGGLSGADLVIALGKHEYEMLIGGYGVNQNKVHIVSNGIKAAFFQADERAFRERFDIQGPYALNVASVSPYKNQMTALRALRGMLPLVVIGPCAQEHGGYLEELQRYGGEWFNYLGVLDNDDPALPSAYAGASVFVLPSKAEVQPISALEAMAADCPVIITKNHSLDVLSDRTALPEAAPYDVDAIANFASELIAQPPAAGHLRNQVAELSWDKVARQLLHIYASLASGKS